MILAIAAAVIVIVVGALVFVGAAKFLAGIGYLEDPD